MAKPFDATLNTLIDAHSADWAKFFATRCGIPDGPAESLDTDLSVTVQPDKVFRIGGPRPALLHLELEGNPRLGIPADLLRYNVLLGHQHQLPVHSVLLLLRPKANATDMTGLHQVLGADGSAYLKFRYSVVRVWQEPVSTFLAGGIGLAPLALLTNEADADLPTAFQRFNDTLRQAKTPDNVTKGLTGSTFVLCGLRYDQPRVDDLYRRVSMLMEESTTYQWILSKGMAKEAQHLLVKMAQKRFGVAPPATDAAIRAIEDRERLERMIERIADATGWDDLLATT